MVLEIQCQQSKQKSKQINIHDTIVGIAGKLIRLLKIITKELKKDPISDDKDQNPFRAKELERQIIKLNDAFNEKEDSSESREGSTNKKEVLGMAIQSVSEILGKDFCLILDNLDFAFHIKERSLYFNEDPEHANREAMKIHEIVHEFYESPYALGRLAANIIFVLRPESYEYLEATVDIYPGTQNPYEGHKNLYSVGFPEWDKVVTKRKELLRFYLDGLEAPYLSAGAISALNKAVIPLEKALDFQLDTSTGAQFKPKTLADISELSNHGLRDVLKYFKNHAWVTSWVQNDTEKVQFERYLNHKAIGIMAYILDNRALYSQMRSGFPNVFLISAEKSGKTTYPVQNDKSLRVLRAKHPHTYWLKYLILRYIGTRDEFSTTTNEILDIFCGHPAENQNSNTGKYSEVAVRLCLGSLTERVESNLLFAEKSIISKTVVISNIRLTKRANYMLKDLLWRFYYLQLIVDDHMLPLPYTTEIRKKFSYSPEYNYKYLIQSYSDFSTATTKMVLKKVDQVTNFLAILKVHSEIEKEKYSSTMELLRTFGVELPSMEMVFRNFIKEVESLYGYLDIHTERTIGMNLISKFQTYERQCRQELGR